MQYTRNKIDVLKSEGFNINSAIFLDITFLGEKSEQNDKINNKENKITIKKKQINHISMVQL